MKALGQILYETGNRAHFGEHGDYLAEHEDARASHEAAAQAVIAEYERRQWREIDQADKTKKILIWWDGDWSMASWLTPGGFSKIKPYWIWAGVGCRDWKRKHQPTHFRLPPPPPEVR